MFENKEQIQIIGKPDIDTNARAINRVIAFLDTCLPAFPNIFKEKTSKIKLTHEDDISQELSIYLNRQCKKEIFMIHFQYRYVKTGSSSDFGIIAVEDNCPNDIDKAFFVLEAKHLPLPKPDKSREKEYVIGNPKGGGIERFKKGNHGNFLPKSAMIAYIQSETCSHWHEKVNMWIQDLIDNSISKDIIWDSNDLLTFQQQLSTVSKYKSRNKRIYKEAIDEIQLLHYWLPLNI
jgi:hypothetical protein